MRSYVLRSPLLEAVEDCKPRKHLLEGTLYEELEELVGGSRGQSGASQDEYLKGSARFESGWNVIIRVFSFLSDDNGFTIFSSVYSMVG